MKYHCWQCEHKPTFKSALNKRKRAVHEGVKYPCSVTIRQLQRLILLNVKEQFMKGWSTLASNGTLARKWACINVTPEEWQAHQDGNGPEQVPDLQHRLLIVRPDGGPGHRQAVSGFFGTSTDAACCMLSVFILFVFPYRWRLAFQFSCVYRYLVLSSYRFRVEAFEAAMPNTSHVFNKYYFEAALPKG